MLLHAEEAFENEWEIGVGNADAVVGYGDLDLVGCDFFRHDCDLHRLGSVLFQRVLDEVEKNLGPIERVALHLNSGNVAGDPSVLLFDH